MKHGQKTREQTDNQLDPIANIQPKITNLSTAWLACLLWPPRYDDTASCAASVMASDEFGRPWLCGQAEHR